MGSLIMPLHGKYSATDLARVLSARLEPIKVYDTSGREKFLNHGGISKPYGYESPSALVLFPVTDRQNQQLRTLSTGLKDIKPLVQAAIDTGKKIITPVTESQKILGLFPRNHWVTLEYDPKTNTAHLIDSRPWVVSFLYPTTAMETLLKDGLRGCTYQGTEINVEKMRFNKSYQNVQHNDTHCGAWTAANVMGLAGATGTPESARRQVDAFTSDQEVSIVNQNIELVGDPSATKLSAPTGWFQKFLIRLGLAKYTTAPSDSSAERLSQSSSQVDSNNVTTKISSSHQKIITMTNATAAGQPRQHRINDWELVDDEFEENKTPLAANKAEHDEDEPRSSCASLPRMS